MFATVLVCAGVDVISELSLLGYAVPLACYPFRQFPLDTGLI